MRVFSLLQGVLGALVVVFTGCEVAADALAQQRAMVDETVALYGTTTKRLLYPIKKIKSVYGIVDSTGRRVDYKEGVDYVQDGEGIRRTSGSAIYDFNNYVATYKPDGKFTWVDTPRNPPFTLFLQVFVDYVADIPVVNIPALAQGPINRRVVLGGDSVAGGTDTISSSVRSSTDDSWIGLISKYFNTKFAIQGLGINGASITSLLTILPSVLSDPPGLFIIAFGMNDHSEMNQPTDVNNFKDKLRSVIDQCQAAGVPVLVVGFPAENPDWENFSLERTLLYNQAEQDVAAEKGVPFVDVYSPFEQVKTRKELIDFFGDNYHHPGNFGQRIYFSKMLPYLLSTPVSSADVPEFVVVPGSGP